MNQFSLGFGRVSMLPLLLFLAIGTVVPMVAQQPERTQDPEGELQKLEELQEESMSRTFNDEREEDVKGREEWFMFQRRFPYNQIPARARAQAVEQTKAMERRLERALRNSKSDRASILASSTWEEIGPFNVGGRVRAIVSHPVDLGTIYIGAASGGVWKSTNGGESWATTFDTLSALTVGALAIDPVKPEIIYAGTGEDSPHTATYFGDGLFKSTDGGESWRNVGLREVAGFSELYVQKQNNNIVYATATKSGHGFYRSTDAGQTWTRTFTFDDVYDMAVNPSLNNEVFIATSSRLYRSTDGGQNFTDLNISSNGVQTSSSVRISVALAPSEPSRIYILLARGGGVGNTHLGQIYRSDDGGNSWTLSRTFNDPYPNYFFNTQGFYNNCLEVHPTNPDIVLAGGIDVYRTVNGGGVWTNITRGYSGGSVHVDQHEIRFDPAAPGIVYLGNDGGVYVSFNAGGTFDDMGLELPITQYYKMDVDPTRPYRVFGGSQDNGSHGTVGDGEYDRTWDRLSGGDGFWVAVDLENPNIVYTEIYYGERIYQITLNNAGQVVGTRSIQGSISEAGDWSSPLAMSPADKKSLYSGRRNLYRTTDRGRNWQQIATGLGGSDRISAIGLSYTDADKIAVGSRAGNVLYSTNGGSDWEEPEGLPRRSVTDLHYDPANGTRLYVTFSGFGSGHVYRSDNNGATFSDISSNLPDVPVNTIESDPDNPNVLFIGTDAGTFISLDGGDSWLPFNDGLPLAPVVDLRVHQLTRSLIAATHGRSMHRVSIDNPQPQPLLLNPVGGETFTTPDSLRVEWIGLEGPVTVSLSFDGGETYPITQPNIVDNSIRLALPFIKTDRAMVRVEENTGGRALNSGLFSLTPASNTSGLSGRGFVAEALAQRNGVIWATVRDSNQIVLLKPPLLFKSGEVFRSGIPGVVRDMAYDPSRDQFYVLTTEANYTAPKVYRMDTLGASLGEITLPQNITAVSGVATAPGGLAVITPGDNGMVYILDPANGSVLSQTDAIQNPTGDDRRALTWDGAGFVQGVLGVDRGNGYPSELQRLSPGNPPTVIEELPLVTSKGDTVIVVGLVYDRESTPEEPTYYITDTSGAFYRIKGTSLPPSGVRIAPGIVSRELAIAAVSPNPFRENTTVTLELKHRRDVLVGLYTATGEQVMTVFEGTLEPGRQTIEFSANTLSSGVYYLSVAGGGERDVRPVVVVK